MLEKVPGVADLGAAAARPAHDRGADRPPGRRATASAGDIKPPSRRRSAGEAGRALRAGRRPRLPADGAPARATAQSSAADAIGLPGPPAARQVPLADVAEIGLASGVSYIYREDGSRYLPVRFSVRGRDPASTVAEAQEAVARRVELPPGYRLDWVGEFRNLQSAIGRLMVVVPVALALILVLLYVSSAICAKRWCSASCRCPSSADFGRPWPTCRSASGRHRLPGAVRHHRHGGHHGAVLLQPAG